MTDGDAWEAHCAAGEGPPIRCPDCPAVFAPDEDGEAEAHCYEHYVEWLRAQCPIPPPESRPWISRDVEPSNEESEEVPF